jgi:hypothetical protein
MLAANAGDGGVREVKADVCRPNVNRDSGLDDIAVAHRYMEAG